MAVARCVGVSLAVQGGAPWSSKRAHKLREGTIQHDLVKIPSGKQWRRRNYWQSVGIHQNLKLGLGFAGWPCRAAKQDSGYKRSVPKKVAAKKPGKASLAEAPESLKSSAKWSKFDREQEPRLVADSDEDSVSSLPLPKPPAGFILDESGKVVLMAPPGNRLVTIVDPATRRPLECMIRRAFLSSEGEQCLLLLPLDMPLQILKIEEEREGLRELSDAELDEVLPTAAYALAKRRLHLIVSGFCLTARGGFCYTEADVMDLNTEYGEGLGGTLAEGVEIASFQMNDSEYLMYTPFDPLMFVAHKTQASGELIIADDELLDDEAVLGAIDEENEFQALVEEEEAINEALREAK